MRFYNNLLRSNNYTCDDTWEDCGTVCDDIDSCMCDIDCPDSLIDD